MMERALKERIIGAIVLVVFVVLVVPIFLDGPPADGEIVSQRVLLPGQEGQDTKTVILNRERSDPIPVASRAKDPATEQANIPEPQVSKTVPPPVPQRSTARVEQEPEPAAQTAAPKTAVSTTGMWAVQLGSFSNKQNAEKLAADLRKLGYAAFLSQLKTSSGPLHRVRIGPQKDRESAEEMAARLLKVNQEGQVVPHP